MRPGRPLTPCTSFRDRDIAMTTRAWAFLLVCAVSAVGIAVLAKGGSLEASLAIRRSPQTERPVDRTTPRLNRMSPAQRQHAQLHAEQGKDRFGNTRLLDEKVSIVRHIDYGPVADLKPAREVFTSIACRVDAIIVGQVSNAESLPTEDGRMLFTDHSVVVHQVFRAPAGQQLAMPVTVTRLGGAITVDGTTVTAKLDNFPPLELGTTGATYLLFLDFLPRFKTFHAKHPADVWEIRAGRVRPLVPLRASDENLPALGVDLTTVNNWLRGLSCR